MSAEDQQVQALADAVVQKAGYLDTWQFWAEWTGTNAVLGAAAAPDAVVYAASSAGDALENAAIQLDTALPGGISGSTDFVKGLLTRDAVANTPAIAGRAAQIALRLLGIF